MVELSPKKHDKRKIETYKVILYAGLGTITLIIALVLLFTDPIQIFMNHYTRVANGSFAHNYMLKRDQPGILVSVYVFNITNPEEFTSGDDDKLKLEEFGPFTYQEFRSYDDLELDLDAGVIRFTPSVKLVFKEELSIGSPWDFNVTMPNIPMLGLASKAGTYSLLAQMPFNALVAHENSKALVSKSVDTYLWGYTDPLISIASNILGVISFKKMGIMDRMYDKSMENHLEVSALDEDKYVIKRRNGHKKLMRSPFENPDLCDKCSTFENTYEGVAYRTELTPEFPLRIFRNGLCKVLDLEYDRKIETEFGSEALVYNFSDSFFSDPDQPINGVLEMSDCFYGIPLGVSKPHFLDVDPQVYARIEGMKPDERFRGYALLEPKIGLELDTKISVQINLILGDLGFNSEAKSFSNMVVPICYLSITQPPLPEESIATLKQIYVTFPIMLIATKVLLLVISIVSWVFLIKLFYCTTPNLKS